MFALKQTVIPDGTLLTLDGDAHTKLRQAFQHAFNPRAYQLYLPIVHKMMSEFLDGWEKQSTNIPIYLPLKNLTLRMVLVM